MCLTWLSLRMCSACLPPLQASAGKHRWSVYFMQSTSVTLHGDLTLISLFGSRPTLSLSLIVSPL